MSWIRCSTGRLCIELIPSHDGDLSIPRGYRIGPALRCSFDTSSLLEPPDPAQIIKNISMQHYHEVCSVGLAERCNSSEVPINKSVHLGSVVYRAGDCEIGPEVACLSDPQFSNLGWQPLDPGHELASGWIRLVGAGNACYNIDLSKGQRWERLALFTAF
jgi:hypothetical protein